MKTMKQWDVSELNFTDFISTNDEIDGEIYFYFLGCVPPRKITKYGFLCGEPSALNSRGEMVYEAFYLNIFPPQKYVYAGLKTVDEFMGI